MADDGAHDDEAADERTDERTDERPRNRPDERPDERTDGDHRAGNSARTGGNHHGRDGGSDEQPPYDPGLTARRASSFGAVAAAYAEHRPDYPEDAVRWALEPAGGGPDGGSGGESGRGSDGRPEAGPGRGSGRGPGRALHVLDLGAGTGKLSAVLAGLGHRVTAVEPDAGMRAELRRRVPAVTALAGSAERIPLPDASVDAVLAGQAFHWFDQDLALPEIARVLRPGGPLAALSNADDDRVEWIAGLGEVSVSQVSFVNWGSGRGIHEHPAFSPVEAADFPHSLRRTVESMVETVATHSQLLVLEPAEREEIKARVRAYLRSRPETSSGEFDLRLVSRVQRCTRRVN